MAADVDATIDELIEDIVGNYGRAAGIFDPNRLEVWEEAGPYHVPAARPVSAQRKPWRARRDGR